MNTINLDDPVVSKRLEKTVDDVIRAAVAVVDYYNDPSVTAGMPPAVANLRSAFLRYFEFMRNPDEELSTTREGMN